MKTKYHSYKGLAAACAVAFALTGCSMLETPPKMVPGSEAAKLYPRAAAGDAIAQYELACCYESSVYGVERNAEEEVKWFLKSAKQGYADAQYTLGLIYKYNDLNTVKKKDPKEAVRWFRAAAQAGHPGAQYNLAKCYEEGYGGLPKDMTEAFQWYRRSALQGDDGAMFPLAKCYDYGKGCPPSRKDAIYWYRKSIEGGFDPAYSLPYKRLKELGAL